MAPQTEPVEMTKIKKSIGSQNRPSCRFCGTPLQHTFVDLGMSPLCESYRAAHQWRDMETFYPLHVFVCENCLLVQLEEFVSPDDIFSEYAYFSSFSDSWLAHVKAYTEQMIERFGINQESHVVELASNDGYLLQYFVECGIPVLGVEPAANIAKKAREKGIPTVVKFFGVETAKELAVQGKHADLIAGNNVYAHIPDINDFTGGIKILLKPAGVVTLEFPHLMRLMAGNQFDTIYHEHFSYHSFMSAEKIMAGHGITVFDVDELSTHGGSLRVYGRHEQDESKPVSQAVESLRQREVDAGFGRLEHYTSFGRAVERTKWQILEFLINAKRQGKTIAGYGAPGKGNTLLNYCGIRSDFLDYTVDRNPYKHGKFLPGTHIPIYPPERIEQTKPDYVFILPWNLKDEIIKQLDYIRAWGGRFVVPIPNVEVIK